MAYDAFISYSHAADGRLAPALQRAIQRLAKPWYRARALRVFRDESALSANPHLWSSIECALDEAEWFVLLASPEAVASEWVGREVDYWLSNKSPDRLLVVVTGGTWEWDTDARALTGTAAPESLRRAFVNEPRHVDLQWAANEIDLDMHHARFRDAVAQLAAPMHGVAKDDLDSEDVRQYRRARRLARGGASVLTLLLVLSAVTSSLAIMNARRAHATARRAAAETRVARSHALTLASRQALADGRPDTALLLAVEAVHLDDNAQSVAALHAAPPYVRGYLSDVNDVVVLATSGDQRVVAALGADGTVLRWDMGTLRRLSPTLRGDPSMRLVALNGDGSLVAEARPYTGQSTAAGAALRIWNAHTGLTRAVAVGDDAFGVGALAFDSRRDWLAFTTRHGISVIDARNGGTIARSSWPCDVFQSRGCATRLAFDRASDRLAIASVRQLLPNDRTGELGVSVSVWSVPGMRRIAGPFAGAPLREQAAPGVPLGDIGLDGDLVWSLAPEIAGGDSVLRGWSVRDGSAQSVPNPAGTIVAYSGGDTVAYRTAQNRLHVAASTADVDIADLGMAGAAPPPITFAADAVLVASRGGPISVIDPARTQQARRDTVLARSVPPTGMVDDVEPHPPALSDDGSTVTEVTPNGDIATWHSTNERTFVARTIHPARAVVRAFPSPDGSRVIALTGTTGASPLGPVQLGTQQLLVYDRGTGRRLARRTIDCVDRQAETLLTDHAATTLVWQCLGTANIWRPGDNAIRMIPTGTTSCRSGQLALSNDGTEIAVRNGPSCASSDTEIHVYDLNSGRQLAAFGSGTPITSAAFDSRGRTIAVVHNTGEIELRSTTGRLRGSINPGGTVVTARFGRDNVIAATVSNSGSSSCGTGTTVELFDATTLQPRGTPMCDAQQQTVASATPDTLVGVGVGTLQPTYGVILTTWDLRSSTWLHIACTVANRALTTEEWALYADPSIPYHESCPEQTADP